MQHTSAVIVDEGLRPLHDMLTEFVLVGGASIGLWIDQPAAPPARPTNDIDLVVLVRTRPEYHRVGERLRDRGFSEDSTSHVLCRWRNADGTDAFDAAQALTMPSGAVLRVATVPFLIAAKFDAFDSPHRSDGGDYLASADMHDIMALVDSHTPFEATIESAPQTRRGGTRATHAASVEQPDRGCDPQLRAIGCDRGAAATANPRADPLGRGSLARLPDHGQP